MLTGRNFDFLSNGEKFVTLSGFVRLKFTFE